MLLFLINFCELYSSQADEGSGIEKRAVIPKRIVVTHYIDLCNSRMNRTSKHHAILKNVDKIRYLNPTYNFICYDDLNGYELIRNYDKILADHFLQESIGMYKADLIRAVELWSNGGFYSDCDLEHFTGMDEIIEDYENPDFITVKMKENNMIFQAFIGSIPGHPVLKRVLDEYRIYYDEIAEKGNSTHKCYAHKFGHLGPCMFKVGMEGHYGEDMNKIDVALMLEHKPRNRFIVTDELNEKKYFNSRFAGYTNSNGWMELSPYYVESLEIALVNDKLLNLINIFDNTF